MGLADCPDYTYPSPFRQNKKTRRRACTHAAQQAMPQITDHTPEIERAILAVDRSLTRILSWPGAKEVYVTLQQAWMERDWAKNPPI